MEWLRERRVILPALATLESLVRSVRGTVERQVYWQLANSLAHEQKTELAKLLELGPEKGSLLGWLRRVPRSCSAAGMLDLIRRLLWVRGTRVPNEAGRKDSTAAPRPVGGAGRPPQREPLPPVSPPRSATQFWPRFCSRFPKN